MDDLREDGGWHLDKRLNVSHLITTLLLVVATFTYANGIDKRISILEESKRYQEATNAQVTQELRSINAKLDRLIERLSE